ncbi:MAG: 2-amino-4-hydroxy-6-hydroxymethyldihydropteridine diphosphokinase [Sphingomicrobium sp.]
MDKHLYAIAIGSNRQHGRFGVPVGVVRAAIERLECDFDLFTASAILVNPAHGLAGRDFANAMALIESGLEPPAMLQKLKAIEKEFGRQRGRRWGNRVLDLDIVVWSGGLFRSRRLTIPHREIERRDFVLQPLATVAPEWRISGPLTARHLAARLARRAPRG